MKPHILLINPITKRTDEIHNFFSKMKEFDTKIVRSIEQAQHYLQKNSTNLVVLYIEKLSFRVLDAINLVRKDDFPALCLSENISAKYIEWADEYSNLMLLPFPAKKKEIIAISEKLIFSNKAYQRRHQRFDTNQSTRINHITNGFNSIGEIRNLSKTGALITLKDEELFQTGDLVRLDIPLEAINKEHNLHAKIVWKSEESMLRDKVELGVQFIQTDEVYKHLLAGI